jgi:hypothetical protein
VIDRFHAREKKEVLMSVRFIALAAALLGLCGCNTLYYGAMEKVGVHKRDIMVDRVKDARDTQRETKKQFLSAMEQFKSVVNVPGSDLEAQYNTLNGTLQKSERAAADVHKRIKAVEDVSEALFSEWRSEIKQYSSPALKSASQQKFDATQRKYGELIAAMRRAESKLEPALVPLRDQVLFMKHNLNARAIAGLSDELVSVQANVDTLIREMEAAITQADAFITALQAE